MTETRTYKGTRYENGELPERFLRPLNGSPGAFLREDAAESYNRMIVEVAHTTGLTLTVRGWNRTAEEQEKFFHERYKVQASGGIDARWHGTGDSPCSRHKDNRRYVRKAGVMPAARPHTSNHGWGTTIDVDDFGVGAGNARFHQARPIMEKHGWSVVEGLSISEPWHWEYQPLTDRYKGKDVPMDPELAEMIRKIHGFLFVKKFSDGKGATTLENILERQLDVVRDIKDQTKPETEKK